MKKLILSAFALIVATVAVQAQAQQNGPETMRP